MLLGFLLLALRDLNIEQASCGSLEQGNSAQLQDNWVKDHASYVYCGCLYICRTAL